MPLFGYAGIGIISVLMDVCVLITFGLILNKKSNEKNNSKWFIRNNDFSYVQ
jgi:hypothetical protein